MGIPAGLFAMDAATGETRRLLPAFDRSIGCDPGSDQSGPPGDAGPLVTEDGSILCIATDAGNAGVYSCREGEDLPHALICGDPFVIRSFDATADGRTIAYVATTPTCPPALFIWDGARSNLIFDPNTGICAGIEASPAERLVFQARDGTPIEGWVMKPAGFEEGSRYPLVMEIHGGPHSQYGNAFFHEFQCLCAKGFGVFYCNPRGSIGYGLQFAQAIKGDWCGIDASDLEDGAGFAGSLSWVDPSRLGVTGSSQGGYFTNWLISHTQAFKAAVTQRSMSNLYSKYGTADNGVTHDKVGMGGADLWTDEELLMERSPVRYAPNVRTPLLIIHSEADYRCPIEQAEQWYSALKRLGKAEVEFVRFAGENHELSRSGKPSNRVERLRRIVGWFEKRL